MHGWLTVLNFLCEQRQHHQLLLSSAGMKRTRAGEAYEVAELNKLRPETWLALVNARSHSQLS
jgi:hypothetical protein